MELKNMFTFSTRIIFRALTFCLLGTLVACSSEEEIAVQPTDPSGPITFTTNINSGAATRATNDQWAENDKVGIYMLDGSGFLSKDYHRANSEYKIERDAGDTFWQLVSTNTVSTDNLYYPADNSKVHFTAYYPYDGNIAKTFVANAFTVPGTYSVTLGNQDTPELFDLLYHKGAVDYQRSENANKVPLMEFKHQLSKVIINIKLSSDLIKVDQTSAIGIPNIAIEGIPTTAEFSLADGTFDELDDVSDENDVNLNCTIDQSTGLTSDDVYASCEMIIVPHVEVDNFTNRKINVTFDDPDDVVATLVYDMPDNKVFNPGKQTTYTFIITRDVIIVENVTILDWDDDANPIIEQDL